MSKVDPKFLNSQFDADIIDLSFAGLGVSRHSEGFVVFVDGVLPEEKVTVEIYKIEKNFAFGFAAKVINPSPHRVKAPCPYQGVQKGQCGGCGWMHIDVSHQLILKEKMIRDTFRRKNLRWPEVFKTVGSEKTVGYRSRARIYTHHNQAGFLERGSRNVVDVEKCVVLEPSVQDQLTQIRSLLPEMPTEFSFYEVDSSTQDRVPKANQKTQFSQTNRMQNKQIKSWLKEDLSQMKLPKGLAILELFSGSGNLTKPIAEALPERSIVACEGDKRAHNKAKQSRVQNIDYQHHDLYNVDVEKFAPPEMFGCIVLDPPRAGFHSLKPLVRALETIQVIYYLSCNVESMVKDIQPLVENGWEFEALTLFDMFPNTPHSEVLVKLVSKGFQ